MTKQELLIVSAYTGVVLCDYKDFYDYAAILLGHDVSKEEVETEKFWTDLQLRVSSDFNNLRYDSETGNAPTSVAMNMYDEEATYHHCAVQVLRNSLTGEQSIGWWFEDEPPAELDKQ